MALKYASKGAVLGMGLKKTLSHSGSVRVPFDSTVAIRGVFIAPFQVETLMSINTTDCAHSVCSKLGAKGQELPDVQV